MNQEHQAKRQKLAHQLVPIAYPHIPESAQDREENTTPHSWQKDPAKLRLIESKFFQFHYLDRLCSQLVEEIESTEWGNTGVAAARAALELIVNQENEQLIRTFHPSLAVAPVVYVLEEKKGESRFIWIVMMVSDFLVQSTHAGGREIHVVPTMEHPNPQIYQENQRDWIRRRVNPRLMLTAHDMNAIRTMFPSSTGVRILIAGWAVVLFASKDEMVAGWRKGVPDTIGELYVGYDIHEATPTIATTRAGYAVSEAKESFESLSALGLRLKMRDGREVITAVTHGFVHRPERAPILLRVAEWILRAKEAITRFRTIKPSANIPAQVTMRAEVAGNSPLGKEVWLSGTDQRVSYI